MKHLWQRLINKIARKLKSFGTLDKEPLPPAIETIPYAERMSSEAQLLSMFRMGEAQGEERGYQKGLEASMRQKGYEQSAWNSEPERITEKPTIIPQPRGQYAKLRLPEFRKTELMPIVERPDGFLL